MEGSDLNYYFNWIKSQLSSQVCKSVLLLKYPMIWKYIYFCQSYFKFRYLPEDIYVSAYRCTVFCFFFSSWICVLNVLNANILLNFLLMLLDSICKFSLTNVMCLFTLSWSGISAFEMIWWKLYPVFCDRCVHLNGVIRQLNIDFHFLFLWCFFTAVQCF